MTTTWPEVALGELASIERVSICPESIQGGTAYVGLENMTSTGRFDGVRHVANGDLASQKFRFSSDHVLYGKLRPYLAKIAAPDFNGVCSTDILPIRCGPNLDKRYLLHFLRQPSQVALATASATGANLPRLSPQALARMVLPLPLIEEQRSIAAVLDKAEALRVKRWESTALLDSLTESIFLDMFGDPVFNRREWERVPLGSLLARVDSGKSPICLSRPAAVAEWGVLKLGSVTWCEYDDGENKALPDSVARDERHEVRAGDVLLARKNTVDLVGSCAYVHETRPQLLLSDLIFRLVPRANAPLEGIYLHRLLSYRPKRRQLQQLAGGSAGSMPNISKARLLEFEVELPPEPLQKEFVERASVVRETALRARASVVELGALFASLQARAFSGAL